MYIGRGCCVLLLTEVTDHCLLQAEWESGDRCYSISSFPQCGGCSLHRSRGEWMVFHALSDNYNCSCAGVSEIRRNNTSSLLAEPGIVIYCKLVWQRPLILQSSHGTWHTKRIFSENDVLCSLEYQGIIFMFSAGQNISSIRLNFLLRIGFQWK